MVDSVIRLFEATASVFTSNGLGYLPNASKCEVVEERNGAYELEMEYPVDGVRFDLIQMRSIIVTKPSRNKDPQPFRVYAISKPFNGIVTINAEHISYDTSNYPVNRFAANNLTNAVVDINTGLILPSGVTCPFILSTDMVSETQMVNETPESMRALIGGSNNSLLQIYGGELEFDMYNIRLLASRGSNKGVSIRYGKNLTDLRQEENCSNVYTAVYPYYHYKYEYDTSVVDELWTLDGDGLVPVEGNFDFVKILPLDVSSEWNNTHEWTKEYPSKDEIRAIAEKYIAENKIGVPNVNITVSFEMLSQTEEYKNFKILEDVELCDTVMIEFSKLGISTKSKCIKTTYDVLTGKYVSIELGEAMSNFASSMVSTNQEIEKEINSKVNSNFVNHLLENATQLITGNLGGYVILHDGDGDGHPDEILIMDKPNIDGDDPAQKIWRWNQAGLAYSKHGYNPDRFEVAITQEGQILGQFIAAHTMLADAIYGGTFVAGGFDNQSGVIQVRSEKNELLATIDKNGITFANDSAITIKWGQVSGTDGVITDDNKSTKIGKDFIKTLNLTVGNEISMGDNATISWGKVTGKDGVITDDNKSTKIGKDFIKTLKLEVGKEIIMGSDATISWSKVTGTDNVASKNDIPSDAKITQISQASVTSENIKGTYLEGKEIRATSSFQMDTYWNAFSHSYAEVISSGWTNPDFGISSPITIFGNAARASCFWYCPILLGTTYQILLAQGIDSMIWTESQSKGKYIHVNTSIDGAYGITVWASDTRLKKNIKDTEQTSLDKIKQIRFIQFDWKSNDAHVDLGISANELEKIVPEAVFDVKQNPDDKYESLKNIDTSMMVVYALKAIQEQQSEIEELKEQVNKLMSLIEERM